MTPDDAPAFFALNSHPDVMRLTGEPPLQSESDARRAIAEYPDFDTYGYGRWGCVLKENNAIIGFCGLKYLTDLDAVDIGYRFLPEYWGRGYATEACRASVVFGFDVLNLERIIGLVLEENTASIRVLEKIGMKPDGEITYEGQRALRYAINNGDHTPA
ncbi:MAG: GNAT family N-acetyltransferase [Phycisphaerales bacterium]|nr:GNAT family N-acetyltransferase [Phycisphaerales bacterium]